MLKLFRFFNLFVVTGYLIVAPAMSYATPFLAIPWLVSEAGVTAMSQVAVGTAGLGIAVAIAKPSSGDPSEICLAATCQVTPAGWSRDSSGIPVPPSSTTGTQDYKASCDPQNPGVGTWEFIGVTSSGMCYWGNITYPVTKMPYGMATAVLTCPSGYSGSGTTCNLTNAASVRKPSGTVCQIIRTGSSFGFDTTNPSCDSASNAGYLCNTDGTCVYISGDDLNVVPAGYVPGSTGQDHSVIAPVGSGGRVKVQTVSGSGTSGQATNNTVIDLINGTPTVVQQDVTKGDTTPTTTGGSGSTNVTVDITCSQIGTCGVAQDSTVNKVVAAQNEINANLNAQFSTANTVPAISASDYAPAISSLNNSLPHPSDYQGPVSTILAKIGFPQPTSQCSLTRSITFHGVTKTIDFIPQGICAPYQEIANWMTWGGVVFLAWRQVKSMAGDKEDLPGST